MLGQITKLVPDRGFGFIKEFETGISHFFHYSSIIANDRLLIVNARVQFEIGFYKDRQQAVRVEILESEQSERTGGEPHQMLVNRKISPYEGPRLSLTDEERKAALLEIASWKLEAKFDDLNKYFFNIPAVQSLMNGSKCYVVGRKGTGKTAIVEHIHASSKESNYLVSKLTFKGFPFNDLYGHDNKSYTRPNQYITIWKLIIYSAACRLLTNSENVDYLVKKKIEKALPASSADDLGKITGKWIMGDFGASVLGNGINFAKWFQNKKKFPINEQLENIEAFFLKNVGNEKIIIMFDELDEDYKDMFIRFGNSDYIDLLTSLFKAVQDIKSTCMRADVCMLPIIFIRDDIYDLLQDPDKNKWRDLQVNLDWSDVDIIGMLRHRLSKTLSDAGGEFEHLWYSLFSSGPIKYSDGKKEISSFSYMKMSTHGRPRDFINYLQECASIQLRKKLDYISGETVKDADKSYSNYLKQELIDEIGGLMPDIPKILGIFSEMRKSIMHISEFEEAFNERVAAGSLSVRDADTVLRTLFYFSVIGNVMRVGQNVFKHARSDAQFNFKEKIIVHRGLLKSLQIV